jgi:hypothetical protein
MRRKPKAAKPVASRRQRYLATPAGQAAQRRADQAYRERKRARLAETADIDLSKELQC